MHQVSKTEVDYLYKVNPRRRNKRWKLGKKQKKVGKKVIGMK